MAINGISFAPSRTVAALFCGDHRAPLSFVADRDGEGVLPMPHNFLIPTIVLIAVKRKSKRDCIGTCDPDEWELPET